MTLPFGTVISSRQCGKRGMVIGYGVLQWPASAETYGDGGIPRPVYLVQLEGSPRASSSLGPACAVFRADMIEEVNN